MNLEIVKLYLIEFVKMFLIFLVVRMLVDLMAGSESFSITNSVTNQWEFALIFAGVLAVVRVLKIWRKRKGEEGI